jgi:hypothetical protein
MQSKYGIKYIKDWPYKINKTKLNWLSAEDNSGVYCRTVE